MYISPKKCSLLVSTACKKDNKRLMPEVNKKIALLIAASLNLQFYMLGVQYVVCKQKTRLSFVKFVDSRCQMLWCGGG